MELLHPTCVGRLKALAFWREVATRWLVIALVAIGATLSLRAEGAATIAGTEFFIAFAPNNTQVFSLELFITATSTTSGTISSGGLTEDIPFTVESGSVKHIVLPTAYVANVWSHTSGIQSYGLRVTASKPVTLYGLNKYDFSSDGYVAIPTSGLGIDYVVPTAPNLNDGYTGMADQVYIVATADSTSVDITPPNGATEQVTLNAGQVFMKNSSEVGSLMGTRVNSDQPIGVFGGNQCVLLSHGSCDHVVEMIPPTTSLGADFFAVRFKKELGTGGAYVDDFVVLAAEDATKVTIDGTEVATLNAGQYHTTTLPTNGASSTMNEGYLVETSKPALAVQYMVRGTYTNNSGTTENGDPAMVVLPPYQQYLSSYTFATMASGFVFDAVNIAAPTSSVGSLYLDGAAIDASEFSQIGTSDYSSAQIVLASGTHSLNSSSPFGIVVYGANNANSYAVAGGFGTAAVAAVTSLDIGTAESRGSNESCFPITLKDSNGQALSGIRVDGAMTGKNPQNVSAVTGDGGVAKVCFVGSEDGASDISFSAGSVSETTSVTWTGCGSGCGVDGQTELPPTVPSAPVNLSAQGTDAGATISFTPGSDGGSPITNYAFSLDGINFYPLDPADASSPISINGLCPNENTGVVVAAINSVGRGEASATVFVVATGSDADADGDSVLNCVDGLPLNPDENTDDDLDGMGANDDPDDTDPDSDGDGVVDGLDAFPSDPNESADSDGDGVGNNADACANTASGTSVDSSGCPNDSDGDGIPNSTDSFPLADTHETTTSSSGSQITIDTTPKTDASSCSLNNDFAVTAAATELAGVAVDGIGLAISFSLQGCSSTAVQSAPGATENGLEKISISFDLGATLIPEGASVFKIRGDSWTEIPGATIVGSVVTYEIIDNGELDTDPDTGEMADPVTVAVPRSEPPMTGATPTSTATATPVPTLPGLLLGLLALLVARLGSRRLVAN